MRCLRWHRMVEQVRRCSVDGCTSPSRSLGMCQSHYNADYRAKNGARLRAANREYAAAHVQQKRAYDAVRYEQIAPTRIVLSRNWYKANKARAAANAAAWQKKHPDRSRAIRAAWKRRHPEAVARQDHKRRALQFGAFVEHVTVAVLAERDRNRCGICGKLVAVNDRSIDHILPLSRGGQHSYANTRLAHTLCNVKRNNRGAAQLRMV